MKCGKVRNSGKYGKFEKFGEFGKFGKFGKYNIGNTGNSGHKCGSETFVFTRFRPLKCLKPVFLLFSGL